MKKFLLLQKSITLSKKYNLLSLILLCLLITISLICGTISSSIPHSITKQQGSLSGRMLFITPDDLIWNETKINQVSSLEHIEFIFAQEEGYWDYQFTLNQKQLSTRLLGSKGSMFPSDIIIGKTTPLNNNEVLIPSVLTFSDGSKENGENYLNTVLTITIPSSQSDINIQYIDLTVVGVYDVTSQVYFPNQLFATMETSLQLNQIFNPTTSKSDKIALIDQHQYVPLVQAQLRANGYYTNTALSFDYTLLYSIQFLSTAIAVLTAIISFLLALLLAAKNLSQRQKDVGILMTLGYNHQQILTIVARSIFLIFMISVISAIFIYSIIYPSIHRVLFSTLYLPIFPTIFFFILSVFLFLIPCIIIFCLFKQLKTISVIEILKDGEQWEYTTI